MKLELKDLNMYYGRIHALRGVSYCFEPGIYGILGPNGAGKSTMIGLITDNIRRQTGDILFDGQDICNMGKLYRSLIGYMPQSEGYYPDFTVHGFLSYIARLKGLKKADTESRIRQFCETFHLEEKQNARVGELSGGMRQRLMLAQALLNDPVILVLDEPTAGVDPQERIQIRNYISMLSQDRVILIATHIVSDVESIANQIILMNHGSFVRSGTPTELVREASEYAFEIITDMAQVPNIQKRFCVSNIHAQEDGIHVRILADEDKIEENYRKREANLEDVYLLTTQTELIKSKA